jgi:hypothetical protein
MMLQRGKFVQFIFAMTVINKIDEASFVKVVVFLLRKRR